MADETKKSGERKVILFMHMSLDGFLAGPNGELDWATISDDDMGRYMGADLLKTVDTMLLGRNLYKGFESYWPAAAKNESLPKELIDFAHWIDDSPKYVFSHTLEEVTWKNSFILKGDIREEVATLKKQPGGDMVIFGGASLSAEFVRLGVVDELRIKLEPVILGKGMPLFKDINDKMKLKLTHSKSFNSGVVGLYYEFVK